MKNYRVGEKDFTIPTSWSDIKFSQYIKIAKLEQMKKSFPFEELYLLKMIEILCNANDGDLDDLTLEDVNEIALDLEFISNNHDFRIVSNVKIGDVDYVFPKDMNRLTMGEYISIKTIQEKIKDDVDMLPYILAIILRPGRKVIDNESGKENWIQSKFDAENIEYRKDLFMNEPVENLIGAINFFLGGSQTSISNTKDYIQAE